MKASEDWLKQKYLRVVTSAVSLPSGMDISQHSPRMSSTWGVIQPPVLDKLKTCQESTNLPASALCSPDTWKFTSSLLKERVQECDPRGLTPFHAPRWQPPHHWVHPFPTPATANLSLSLCVPHSRKGVLLREGMNSSFTLFFTVTNHT